MGTSLPVAHKPWVLTAQEDQKPAGLELRSSFLPCLVEILTLQSTVLRICRSDSPHGAPGVEGGGARCWRPDLVMAFLQKEGQLKAQGQLPRKTAYSDCHKV